MWGDGQHATPERTFFYITDEYSLLGVRAEAKKA